MKTLKRKSLVVAALALCTSSAALADDCTVATLRGTYVFTASGFNIVAGVPQPKAIVEAIAFKGDGTLTVPFATVSVNGAITRIPGVGTGKYTVDAGCSGTISFDNGPSFEAYVSPNASRVWMIQSNSNTVFLGVSENASAPNQVCSNETLKGPYGLVLAGTRPAPSVIPGQPGFVGQLEQVNGSVVQIFDGKGNFTQVDNVKGTISGITPDRPGRGAYTVNADCSVTQTVNPAPGLQITSKGVIVDGGKEFRQNTIAPDAFNVTAIGRRMN